VVKKAVAKPKKKEEEAPWHPWQAPAQLVNEENSSQNAATGLIVRPLSAVTGGDWAKTLGAVALSLFVFGLAFAMYRVPERS
jgi:hypothetical protein